MEKRENENRDCFDLATGAAFLGVSMPTMLRLVNQDDFPAFRIGRRWCIPKTSLQTWANEQAKRKAVL